MKRKPQTTVSRFSISEAENQQQVLMMLTLWFGAPRPELVQKKVKHTHTPTHTLCHQNHRRGNSWYVTVVVQNLV